MKIGTNCHCSVILNRSFNKHFKNFTLKEVENVQFIGFWEYSAEGTDKVIERLKKMPVGEKRPEKFAKVIFGPYTFDGERRGFTIYETDDPEKLANVQIYYGPEMNWKFVPLIDTRKAAELYLKAQK